MFTTTSGVTNNVNGNNEKMAMTETKRNFSSFLFHTSFLFHKKKNCPLRNICALTIVGLLLITWWQQLVLASTPNVIPETKKAQKIGNTRNLMQDEYLELLKNALTGRTMAQGTNKPPNAVLRWSGYNRIAHIDPLIKQLIEEDVEGDFCECGVYLGGMSIYLMGFLKAYGQTQKRHMWVVDSFEGMPSNEGAWTKGQYEGSLSLVRSHFQNYNVLNDDVVHFVQGWFDESLPTAPIEKIAFLHVDCDSYNATKIVLENLYPRMAKGGWIVFDDYHEVNQQQRAVLEYKEKNGISSEVETHIVPGYLLVGRWRVK